VIGVVGAGGVQAGQRGAGFARVSCADLAAVEGVARNPGKHRDEGPVPAQERFAGRRAQRRRRRHTPRRHVRDDGPLALDVVQRFPLVDAQEERRAEVSTATLVLMVPAAMARWPV
jgi:hypothetical protein